MFNNLRGIDVGLPGAKPILNEHDCHAGLCGISL